MFTGLVAGTYSIAQVLQPGWQQTSRSRLRVFQVFQGSVTLMQAIGLNPLVMALP
ncbi:MAG: hypothetical protein EDM05_043070 [Leptolyngbya sp. IPPAS B-1204]